MQADFGSSYTEDKKDGENTTVNSNGKAKYPNSEKNNSSSISFSLSVQYVYSFLRTHFGEFYFGGGPFLGLARSESINDYSYTTSDTSNYSSSTNNIYKTYSLGVIFVLGMKAYITNNFGVFAEANLNGGKNWNENNIVSSSVTDYPSSTDYSSTSTSHESGGGWFYNFRYVRLGISVSI